MDDTKNEKSGFELLPIPQDALGDKQTDETYEVRRIWEKNEQTWYYSIIDFVRLLTKSKNPTSYWGMIKKRNEDDQGFRETLNKIKMIPLRAKDGRLRETDCVTRETMLRIVQSIPSPLAEAVRLWLAKVGEEKLQEVEQQTQEEQLRTYYISKGRTPEWADARIRNLIGRNALTDEWLARGAQQNLHFGILTTTIHRGTFGITPTQHHTIKRLPKSVKHPRDHYTEEELGVLTLAELAARRIHEQKDSQGFPQLVVDAEVAGQFGEKVRLAFEETIGRPVVSSQNFLDQPRGRRKKLQLPQQTEQGSLFSQGETDQQEEK